MNIKQRKILTRSKDHEGICWFDIVLLVFVFIAYAIATNAVIFLIGYFSR